MTQFAISIQDVREAAARIKPFVVHTEARLLSDLSRLVGAREIFAKLENTQNIGAFKIRGATNAVRRLSEEDGKRGVIAPSSGNHAQGIAEAAAKRGFPAHIIMPSNANPLKVEKTRKLGATVHFCEPTEQGRMHKVQEIQRAIGGIVIHSFNHPDVMAGQGTVALEMIQDFSVPFDVILIPVGGCGLISGCATAIRALSPNTIVIGVEPEGANDTFLSLKEGKRRSIPNPHSIADGLLTTVGDLTFPIVQAKVDRVVTVTDEQIREAVRYCYDELKLVVEPSGAVTIAALLDRTLDMRGKRVGIIISGGNVEIEKFL